MLSEDSRKMNGLYFVNGGFMLKGNNVCKSHVTHYPLKIHIYVCMYENIMDIKMITIKMGSTRITR